MPQVNGATMRVATSVMTTPWIRPIRYCLKNETSPMEGGRIACRSLKLKAFFAPEPLDDSLSTHF